jgi:hypothetical protein
MVPRTATGGSTPRAAQNGQVWVASKKSRVPRKLEPGQQVLQSEWRLPWSCPAHEEWFPWSWAASCPCFLSSANFLFGMRRLCATQPTTRHQREKIRGSEQVADGTVGFCQYRLGMRAQMARSALHEPGFHPAGATFPRPTTGGMDLAWS